jgi:hypothetical protein
MILRFPRAAIGLALALGVGGPPALAQTQLSPDTCGPLRTSVAEAEKLLNASLADLGAFGKVVDALNAELEKELEQAGPDDRASRLERLREVMARKAELADQEMEIKAQLERMASSRAKLDTLCLAAK